MADEFPTADPVLLPDWGRVASCTAPHGGVSCQLMMSLSRRFSPISRTWSPETSAMERSAAMPSPFCAGGGGFDCTNANEIKQIPPSSATLFSG